MKPKPSLGFLLRGSIIALFAAPSLHASTYYWDDNAAGAGFGTAGANLGTWAAPTAGPTAGWSLSGTGANAFASFTTATTDTVNFGNGATGLASGTITVSGTVNTGNMTFASGSGAITLSGGTITLGGGRIITANNTGNIIGSELALTGASIFRIGDIGSSATRQLTLGVLSGTGGTTFEYAGTSNGTGLIVLNGQSTYSGNTLISTTLTNANTQVRLDVDNALPTSTILTIGGNQGTGTSDRKTVLNLNGNDQTLAGLASDISAGTTRRDRSVYSATAATLTINDSGNRTFAGTIGEGGTAVAVVKDGSGTWTLSGDNSFANGLTLKGDGAVTLAHSNAAGTGTINLQSTETSTGATVNLTSNINVANAIVIDSSTGRETFNSNGNNTLSGNITIDNAGSNSIVFINSSAANAGTTFTVGGATPNSTTITAADYTNTLSFRSSNSGNFGVLNSQINAPNATVNVNNNGTFTFNSTGNIWAVTTFSNACGLVLGADDALATGAYLNFAATTTSYLDLNGKNQTVAGLAGGNSAAIQIRNEGAANSTLTLSGLIADRTYNGVIADGSTNTTSLVVNNGNAFTQTLSGANTYTGPTTVTAGTLRINGDQSAATGAMGVAASATLGGKGIIGGDVTIADNGKLEFDFSTPAAGHDKLELAAGKSLTLSGASTLTITSAGGASTGLYTLVSAPGGISGSVPATVNLPSGWAADPPTIVGGTDLVINITTAGGVTYGTWSGGAAADLDSNNDGVPNAVAWALGATDVNENAIGLLPDFDNTTDPTYALFTFQRSDDAEADPNTTIQVEYGNNLTGWTTAVHDGDNVIITVDDQSPNDNVTVKLKRSTLAPGGKLFARLDVVVTP